VEIDRIGEALGQEFLSESSSLESNLDSFLMLHGAFYGWYSEHIRLIGLLHFNSLDCEMNGEFFERTIKADVFLDGLLLQLNRQRQPRKRFDVDSVRDTIMGHLRNILIRGMLKKQKAWKIYPSIGNLYQFWEAKLFNLA
jgi:hypothetical protein